MPCGVSELSTTVAPAPRASTDGTIQYSETATTSTAHRPTTASARRHDPGRTTATTTGTATSWNSGTTPAFIPDVAANASANPAGHRQRARRPRPSGPAARVRGRPAARAAAPRAAGSPASCRSTTTDAHVPGWPERRGDRARGRRGSGTATRATEPRWPVAAPGRAGRRRANRPRAAAAAAPGPTAPAGSRPPGSARPSRDRRQPDVEGREAELRVRLPGGQVRGGAAPRREVELRLGVDGEGPRAAREGHRDQWQPEPRPPPAAASRRGGEGRQAAECLRRPGRAGPPRPPRSRHLRRAHPLVDPSARSLASGRLGTA